MADLSGKVAVVTGASRGVGKGIAEGLAEAGATVYVTGRSDGVETAARAVDALGGRGVPVLMDQRDETAAAQLFARIEADEGRLDVLVNNAWPEPRAPAHPVWAEPLEDWDRQYGQGLRGYCLASSLAVPLMLARSSGLVVHVSAAAETSHLGGAALRAAKAGVDRLARDMGRALAPRGVAALALWPGVVKTEWVLAAAEQAGSNVDVKQAQAPRFVGRCIAALAMDPDVLEKAGGVFRVSELAREYRFTDPDRPYW